MSSTNPSSTSHIGVRQKFGFWSNHFTVSMIIFNKIVSKNWLEQVYDIVASCLLLQLWIFLIAWWRRFWATTVSPNVIMFLCWNHDNWLVSYMMFIMPPTNAICSNKVSTFIWNDAHQYLQTFSGVFTIRMFLFSTLSNWSPFVCPFVDIDEKKNNSL